MNMVRVYCVVEKGEFYDVCDEPGMLVLQDFPAQGPLSGCIDMVRRAVPQGRDMANRLYHHPSIITWALGEQPSIENFDKLCMALVTAAGEEDATRFLQQGACVWEWQIAREKYDWPIDYHLLCGWFPPDMNYLIDGHLLPSFMSYLVVHLTLRIPWMILGETSLSFLGLGIRPPAVSWGALLKEGENIRILAHAPWLLIPGLFVVLAVLARADLRDLVRASVRDWVGDEAHWVYVRFHDGALLEAAY